MTLQTHSTTRSQIELVSSRPLASIVQKEIERQILAGELAPGAHLNELEIARDLGISRAPVRESLRSLEQAGLVTSRKNYGVYVRVVSLQEARDIYRIRAYLDSGVGYDLAQGIAPDDLEELQRMTTAMQAALDAGDPDVYFDLNVAFHERMVELTGNEKALDVYRQLLKELHLYRLQSLRQPGAMRHSMDEHRDILAAIAAGNAPRAGQLMREHILASGERLQHAHDHEESASAAISRKITEEGSA